MEKHRNDRLPHSWVIFPASFDRSKWDQKLHIIDFQPRHHLLIKNFSFVSQTKSCLFKLFFCAPKKIHGGQMLRCGQPILGLHMIRQFHQYMPWGLRLLDFWSISRSNFLGADSMGFSSRANVSLGGWMFFWGEDFCCFRNPGPHRFFL